MTTQIPANLSTQIITKERYISSLLSSCVYSDEMAKEAKEFYNLEFEEFIEFGGNTLQNDTQALVCTVYDNITNERTVYVAFRGTETNSVKDIVTDLNCVLMPFNLTTDQRLMLEYVNKIKANKSIHSTKDKVSSGSSSQGQQQGQLKNKKKALSESAIASLNASSPGSNANAITTAPEGGLVSRIKSLTGFPLTGPSSTTSTAVLEPEVPQVHSGFATALFYNSFTANLPTSLPTKTTEAQPAISGFGRVLGLNLDPATEITGPWADVDLNEFPNNDVSEASEAAGRIEKTSSQLSYDLLVTQERQLKANLRAENRQLSDSETVSPFEAVWAATLNLCKNALTKAHESVTAGKPDEIKKLPKLVITGHSLGGALAVLFATRMVGLHFLEYRNLVEQCHFKLSTPPPTNKQPRSNSQQPVATATTVEGDNSSTEQEFYSASSGSDSPTESHTSSISSLIFYHKILEVVTFGCPKIGNDAFAKLVTEDYGIPVIHFVYGSDLVPRLPSGFIFRYVYGPGDYVQGRGSTPIHCYSRTDFAPGNISGISSFPRVAHHKMKRYREWLTKLYLDPSSSSLISNERNQTNLTSSGDETELSGNGNTNASDNSCDIL